MGERILPENVERFLGDPRNEKAVLDNIVPKLTKFLSLGIPPVVHDPSYRRRLDRPHMCLAIVDDKPEDSDLPPNYQVFISVNGQKSSDLTTVRAELGIRLLDVKERTCQYVGFLVGGSGIAGENECEITKGLGDSEIKELLNSHKTLLFSSGYPTKYDQSFLNKVSEVLEKGRTNTKLQDIVFNYLLETGWKKE